MPSVYNSTANLPIGSRSLTIDGVAFVVEGEFGPQRTAREIRRNDQNGDFSARQLRTEPTTLQVTLQRSTTAVNGNGPNLGSNNCNIDGTNFVVTGVKPREVQGGFHMFDVTLVSETLPSA